MAWGSIKGMFALLVLQCMVVWAVSPKNDFTMLSTNTRLKRMLRQAAPPPPLGNVQGNDNSVSALTQAAAVSSFSDPSADHGALVAQISSVASPADPATVDSPASPASPASPVPASSPDIGGGCVGCTAHGNSDNNSPPAVNDSPASAPASASSPDIGGGCVGCTANSNSNSNVPPTSVPTTNSPSSPASAPSATVPTAVFSSPPPASPDTSLPTPPAPVAPASPVPPATPIPTLTDVSQSDTPALAASSVPTDFSIPPIGDKNSAPAINGDANTPPPQAQEQGGACVGCTVGAVAPSPATPSSSDKKAANADAPSVAESPKNADGACIGCTVQAPQNQQAKSPDIGGCVDCTGTSA